MRYQSTNSGFIRVQGILINTHTFPHLLSYSRLGWVILVISHEVEFVDGVREVMDMLLVLQVGNEVREMPIISLV